MENRPVRLGVSLLAALLALLAARDVRSQPRGDEPAAVVERHMKAVAAMDAKAIVADLASGYTLVDTDGSSRPYNREMGADFCDWERVMHTKWTHEILGVDGNVVTVLAREKSDYYDRLNLGAGVQLEQLVVENGKIAKSISKLFITEKSNQSTEYRKFAKWLSERKDLREPDLIRPDGSLVFNGKSAPRMLYWLTRWSEER